jgi:hypothetical protein
MTRPSEIARAGLSPSTVQPRAAAGRIILSLWMLQIVGGVRGWKCPGLSPFQRNSRGFSPGWQPNYSPIR